MFRAVAAAALATLVLAACGSGSPPKASTSQSSSSATQSPASQTSTPSPSTPPATGGGANFATGWGYYPGITSHAAELHLGWVRIPPNDSTLSSDIIAAHNAGLGLLMILYGCSVSDAATRLADNEAFMDEIHAIVGIETVYYELGNEQDLQCGYSAAQYTAMWNGQIPALHSRYPEDRFGGPVTAGPNPQYAAAFMAGASPKPDFISYHQYSGSVTNSTEAQLLSRLDGWSADPAAVRRAIAKAGFAPPPVWVTEFNYVYDGGCSDVEHADANFLNQWTTKALQELWSGGVHRSFIFRMTCLNLVNSDGTLSLQGRPFANFWADP